MPIKLRKKKFVINWLKAFMLSPGILFPAGYLLLYLSTNIYLNADFKKSLSLSVQRATGNRWHIHIKSLKTGWILNSVTLNEIEFTKAAMPENRGQVANHSMTINTLEIPTPHLQQLLFSNADLMSSTNALCEKIIAEKSLVQ